MKIGIVGNGFVGKATKLLKTDNIDIIVYDIRKEACEPLGTGLEDIENCDLIFLCLPTPINHNSNCYTQILEDVIIKLNNPFKVIRSTVPIGFSASQKCFFMPEFLTEANWKEDFIHSKYWIFGLLENNDELNLEFGKRITNLFNISKNEGAIDSSIIHWLTTTEAEYLKLAKNCYLAAKVGIMNELYQIATVKGINYDKVKEIIKLDSRIGKTHMDVPGYGNLFGYGGTCFPKDTHSLYSQFQDNNIHSYYFQTSLIRNEYMDRTVREWATDYWRTTIPTNKKISLVTGGAGFLGTNLCKRLLDMDHIVICLDNLSTGNMANIEILKENSSFLFKNADVTNKQFFPKLDYIWHLACPASPPKYRAEPYKTLQTSLLGTMNMLELAKTHNCKFLFTSTSEVYGDPLEHPQKESYWGNVNTVGPRSCYDEGKRCAETLIYEFRNKDIQNMNNYKIVRLFNTYGPYMDLNDGRVITNYINCLLSNKPITIYGDGKQTRSFCYVDDMINAFVKMMDSNQIGPINLGNPNEEFNMNELKECFDLALNKTYPIEYLELPIDDPKQRKPDISLANDKLDWEPTIDIKTGISKTINYFLSLSKY
jgi:UDP-glucuronate decarboxylase